MPMRFPFTDLSLPYLWELLKRRALKDSKDSLTLTLARPYKEEKSMAIRRFLMGLVVASIFVIGIWLLGFVPQATAETLNFKLFNHAMKAEVVPIPDAEGHFVRLTQREGVFIFENGELAWQKAVFYNDLIKGAGSFEQYNTITFQDGSTITTFNKGRSEATPAGLQTGTKTTGEIIHGTGRFQGIKGTISLSSKVLPPEKGEPVGKAIGEGTYVYTLPSK
jgi:hypothetical protein